MKETENINTAELARDLGRAIAEMRSGMRQMMQAKIREHGLNITAELLEVLGILWYRDGLTQQELADIVVKDKSSMTYLIDNLVKRDLVRREESETDKRTKQIYLAEEGIAMREQIMPLVLEIYEKVADGVKIADIEKAIVIVKKMNDNLKR
jgi:DNA-binding MarR family transcriptional regulator